MAIEPDKKSSNGSSSCERKSAGSSSSGKVIPVRVAVRVRPLVPREVNEGCQPCLDVIPEHNQIVIPPEKGFTFDYTFPSSSTQAEVYNKAVSKVVQQLFKGYNVTVLAYGQTGSGKTHSMGTNYVMECSNPELEMGIIPRAVNDIFDGMQQRDQYEFVLKVSFVELYNENLYDLLNGQSREESVVDIRETQSGDIKIQGLTEIPVTTLRETMKCLEKGSVNRATGATAMNAHSSRSHAIFCLHLQQMKKDDSNDLVNAKFTMVDLAGSERAKKTGATGQRFKEGVTINKGLLALGNVISALCDGREGGHIPYRDSKLTRLLQDSLGGNSHTLMLACVSPADNSNDETINTLRYADRARKIKNKPIVNMDPQAAEIARLKQQMQELRLQLLASQGDGGGAVSGGGTGDAGGCTVSSMELERLREENESLRQDNSQLLAALRLAVEENSNNADKALMAEMARDKLKERLDELRAQTAHTMENLNKTLTSAALDAATKPILDEQVNKMKEFQQKVMEIQTEQTDTEKAMMNHEISRHNAATNTSTSNLETSADDGGGDDGDDDGDCGDAPSSPRALATAYTLRQAKLNQELQEINHDLALKEQLLHQVMASETSIAALRQNYEKNIKELGEQIELANKEKTELKEQLNKTTNNPTKLISEQRRKRVQELENTINNLKRQILEKNRVLKEKEQAEKRIAALNKDINERKQQRVKLVKQMKEDSERFRRVTVQKDREISKLKQEDKRKELKMVKMERDLNKKELNLRRRLEETVAINKKLKDALERQKSCADKRANSKDVGNLQIRVRGWLEDEIEVVSVKIQAKNSLEAIREDRKTVADQLQKVKRELSCDVTPDFREELLKRKKELEEELEMRTAQIADIQQKCHEDFETKERTKRKRFEGVQSMVEAKVALDHLFDTAAQLKAEHASQVQEIKMLRAHYNDVMKSVEELESQLTKSKTEHRQELMKLSREHEEKLLLFLRQMAASDMSSGRTSTPVKGGERRPSVSQEEQKMLKERLMLQQAEIDRLSSLHEELQAKIEECDELQRKLQDKEAVKQIPRPTITFSNSTDSKIAKPILKMKKPKLDDSDELLEELELDDTFESDIDDNKNDPDWQKTPLFKRIKAMKRRYKSDVMFEEKENFKTPLPNLEDTQKSLGVKRMSDGATKCGCSSDCLSKRCKCRKSGSACSASCKCNAMMCANKHDSSVLSSDDNSKNSETVLNSTFDVSNTSVSKKLRMSSSASSLNSTAAVAGSTSSTPTGSTDNGSTLKELNSTYLKPSV